MGSATSVATGSVQLAPECGDKIACPAVLYGAVHVLRDGIVAAIQTWRQHDGSAGPGREAHQRHLHGRIAHGFFHGPFGQPGRDACRFCRLMTTAAWHMPAIMCGKLLLRPLLHCTRAKTRVRLSLTSNCLLHMQLFTWEMLLGMVCSPWMAGTASRVRAMTRPYHTACALRLH